MSAESELPKKVKLLLTSTLYNDINGVRRALRFVDVNSSGSDLVTAIHLVAEKGYTEMAKFLVTVKGINLNLRTVYGNTPLKLSVYHNHFKITIILLEAGADPNALSLFDMTPLHTATFHGRLPFVEALIEYKADVNVIDCFDRTPLYMSLISYPSESITYLLLKVGANPNFKNKAQLSLLHLASLGAHSMLQVFTVATLLYFGADVNAKDIKQETPLHKAALSGYTPLINLLVQNGADINEKNIWGQTPMNIAKIHKNTSAIRILEELEDEHIYQELTLLNFPLNENVHNDSKK
ncbi:uncharacterized protein isoform X1 [Rhodnius prolixus]|uniref:uncharacterized protein isoform X1 n=2 Tax=Rhodnius prolixus TaxID=13249 RepID=UPI003D18E840